MEASITSTANQLRRFLTPLWFVLLLPLPSAAGMIEVRHRWTSEITWIDLENQSIRPRENHFGEAWEDGFNLTTALESRLSVADRFDLVVEPILITPREGQDVYFRKGYLRLVVSNIALKIGRDSLWWGPGQHGALGLSNNAFPFDLIALGSDKPFSLPGLLRPLGHFEIQAFLIRLEEDRAVPHPKFFGLRIGYRPVEGLQIGFNRLTMFNGEGRPSVSFLDFFKIYFNQSNRSGKYEINEIGTIDLRLTVPLHLFDRPLALALYGEYGGEDEANFLPSKIGYLVGLDLRDRSETFPRFRWFVEYATNHVSGFPNFWYTHSLYLSGYTYRGQIMGHHMGSDASDLYSQIWLPVTGRDQGTFFIEWERGRLSAPTSTRKLRAGAGWEHAYPDDGPVVYLTGFVEELTPSDPTLGKRRNHAITTGVRYTF